MGTINTVSGKYHILQGWDESEQIYLYIITTFVSDHEEIRGGSEFHMIRTYRFRIYPKEQQIESMNTMLNLSCELYNAMLQQRIYAYRSKKKVNYRSQQNEIPEIKKMFPEYKSMHSLAIQDVARRLDKAFDNFFMRVEEKRNGKNIKAGFPRFKSRDRYSSITYTQSGFRILDNGHVWLSKIGEIRMFMNRSITGDIRTLSVKRDRVGDWFITVTAESLKEESTSPA